MRNGAWISFIQKILMLSLRASWPTCCSTAKLITWSWPSQHSTRPWHERRWSQGRKSIAQSSKDGQTHRKDVGKLDQQLQLQTWWSDEKASLTFLFWSQRTTDNESSLFSLTIGDVSQHLLSYFKKMSSPVSLFPARAVFRSISIKPISEISKPTKVESGADGVARCRGEADDLGSSSSTLSAPLSSTCLFSSKVASWKVQPINVLNNITATVSPRQALRRTQSHLTYPWINLSTA